MQDAKSKLPILYSFRRCPYAIRARLAIQASGVAVEMHEVSLRNKPQALLDASPKGTVPVLQLADGYVIDESLDIMHWALSVHDPQNWLAGSPKHSSVAHGLITQNDGEFKQALNRYKYPERFPEQSFTDYQAEVARFLNLLNQHLAAGDYLLGGHATLVDMAILPFIRQCAAVDKDWFYTSPHTRVIRWLDNFLASALFVTVMQKQDSIGAMG